MPCPSFCRPPINLRSTRPRSRSSTSPIPAPSAPQPHASPFHTFRACATPPPTADIDLVESPNATSSPAPYTPSSSPPGPARPSRVSTSRRPSPDPVVNEFLEVPGPPPLPVVGNALDIVGTQLSHLMLSYARQYGSFLKFSILNDDLFLASDPLAIHHVVATNARNYLDRWTPPGFQILLYDGVLRGLVFSQGKYWMHHRQVVGSVFRSSQFLRHFCDTVIDKTRFMLESLWLPQVGSVVNIHQEMRMLTLDIIGSAAFGKEFGAMTNGRGGHEIESCLSNVLHGVMDVIQCPLPLWRVMMTPGRARIQRDLKRLQRIEMELIRERRKRLQEEDRFGEAESSKSDLLGLLLRAKDSESKGTYFEDKDLMWDVHDIIFAGHETTASALGAALFLIAGSERVRSKLCEELDRVLPDGRKPTFDDVSSLKYLDMVLNEALRLYPPTALIGRNAKEDDVVCGYPVPAGAQVVISPYVMGRMETLWDNPEEFRPERFDPAEVADRHPMSHMPFGAGPRVCLGARMAVTEAKLVLAMIFQKFRIERKSDTLEVSYDSTVSFKSGMDMVLHQRP
eukprot:GFKZ01001051.1.p1 GENE.GFKZ01001051.1~~GFKZ01001051.1.p1  ORF type:complete len:568 (+),score=67.19 GFKZ01001051.1:190-1893(+)